MTREAGAWPPRSGRPEAPAAAEARSPPRGEAPRTSAANAAGTARLPPRRTSPPAHAPAATRQPAQRRRACACACAGRHTAPACGVRGRGGQNGRSGRKGRGGAARPREGECGTPCALRPRSGPVRPPPGVSPAVGGAPWRLAGGSRGGCDWIGAGCVQEGLGGRHAPSLHKKGVAGAAVGLAAAGREMGPRGCAVSPSPACKGAADTEEWLTTVSQESHTRV